MTFKPMVKVVNDPKFYANALVFETETEALENARDLMARWMAVVDYKAEPSEEPANYRYIDHQLVPIDAPPPH